MAAITLRERLEGWQQDLQVDREARLVKNAALAGQSSRNGYRYADDALAGAVALYERKPVFLDHAPRGQRPLDRSARDLAGYVVHARLEEGRIRGDIQALETDAGETFLKLVEANAPNVGMSHVVLAERSADGALVDRILDVISVDAVVNPATTSTFRESCTEFAAGREAPSGLDDLERQCRELGAVNLQLEAALAEAHRREEARRQLEAAGLPAEALSECFREQLLAAPDAGARQRLIQDRLTLCSPGRRDGTPRSQERLGGAPAAVDDLFVRVLRRR